MPVTANANQLSVAHKSSYRGASIPTFPDVCKTPTPGGPVPVPYPNMAAPAASRHVRGLQLRSKLQNLNMQIASLPSGDPARWHRLLDEYVVVTAELYKTLAE